MGGICVSAATYGLIGKTVTDSISYADAELYPNINVILKLLLTLRVGYCACERSFGALRRISRLVVEQQ